MPSAVFRVRSVTQTDMAAQWQTVPGPPSNTVAAPAISNAIPSVATNPVPPVAPTRELSGVMVVIIIAGGVLLSIVLFIFAKRQIMRFTIRSRRGPHAPVGHDAKKVSVLNLNPKQLPHKKKQSHFYQTVDQT